MISTFANYMERFKGSYKLKKGNKMCQDKDNVKERNSMDLPSLSTQIPSVSDERTAQNKSKLTSIA